MSSYRFLACVGALAVFFVAPLPGQTPGQAPKAATKAKSKTVPRTPDGHPDLQGVWTNATITPMERPSRFNGKATISDAEATAYEKSDLEELNKQDGASDGPLIAAAGSSGTGGYNVLFVDRGTELARVDGVKRTSLIVDPPDGKVPPMTDEARKRIAGMMRNFNRYDSIKERPLSERCIIGFGSTAGPPMLPVLYNNNYQIVQTPDAVMILVEMVHDVRIIRMNGVHDPPSIKQTAGRFDWTLGRRHPGSRHHQFHERDPIPRLLGEPACDRALPANRSSNDSLSRHHRRSLHVHQAMDFGISIPGDCRSGL